MRPQTFGEAALAVAFRDLGLVETTANSGPRIDAMLANFGHPPGTNWCGAATGTWIREAAAELGLQPPVAGSALAKGVEPQFKAIGRWRTAKEVRARPGELRLGDAIVFHRGAGVTTIGHIGLLSRLPDATGSFQTIEGNHDQGVFLVEHNLDEQKLYGAGSLNIPLPGAAGRDVKPAKSSSAARVLVFLGAAGAGFYAARWTVRRHKGRRPSPVARRAGVRI